MRTDEDCKQKDLISRRREITWGVLSGGAWTSLVAVAVLTLTVTAGPTCPGFLLSGQEREAK